MKASDKKLALTVKAEDDSVEVFIIDSRFKVVERGRGQMNVFSLAPGIYTVKVKVGTESRSEHVVLLDKPEQVKFARIEFPSAAPLLDTGKTHEYHIEASQNESKKVHVSIGSGSSIFVFVRDWRPKEKPEMKINPRPQLGLQLLDSTGNVIVDIDKKAKFEPKRDPCAACNVQLDPGIYRLALHLQSGSVIEQTVVASPGWQTQVFMLQRNYGKDRSDRRADLCGASILMSKSGFSAGDSNKRLVETARLGLIDTRQVLSEKVINAILMGKFENPMLGILGAHLLLLNNSVKMGLLDTVVTNLRKLLGSDLHPDVEALALRLGKKTSFVFEHPPMLRRSWWHVVDATVNKKGLVPLGSTAAAAAERIWGAEPWLQWKTAPPARLEAVTTNFGLAAVKNYPVLESQHLGGDTNLTLQTFSESGFPIADLFDVTPPQQKEKSLSRKKGRKPTRKLSVGSIKAKSSATETRTRKSKIKMMVKASGLPFGNLEAMYDQYISDPSNTVKSDTKPRTKRLLSR